MKYIVKVIIAALSVFILGETEPDIPEVVPVQQIKTEVTAPVAGIVKALQMNGECAAVEPEEPAPEYDSLELLAVCVEAEAGNQSLEGKRLVVDVILNRVDSAEWPDTVKEVIEQPVQFASYWDGGMERVVEPSEETYEAIRMEIEERSYPSIYYFTADDYGTYGTPWRQVEDHYFSKR